LKNKKLAIGAEGFSK